MLHQGRGVAAGDQDRAAQVTLSQPLPEVREDLLLQLWAPAVGDGVRHPPEPAALFPEPLDQDAQRALGLQVDQGRV